MKKRLAAVLVCALMVFLPVSASADGLTPQDFAARYHFPTYSAPMTEENQKMTEVVAGYDPASAESVQAVTDAYTCRLTVVDEYTRAVASLSAELKLRLIDYDVALKQLRLMIKRYKVLYEACEDGEQAYKLGQMDRNEWKALQSQRDEAHFDIRSAVRDISIAKAEIESITGETLKDSYDFDSLYYITDAMKLNLDTLKGVSGWDTVCYPEGQTAPTGIILDGTKELEAAQSAYYDLGKQLRGYIPLVRQYDEAHRAYLLGQSDAAAFAEAERARDDGYLAVCVAKAAYAKSLIALDTALGGTLTNSYIAGDVLAAAYTETIPDDLRGDGLWGICRMGNIKVFRPMTLPHTVADREGMSYQLRYNGTVIGMSPDGQACSLSEIVYTPAERFAYVTFFSGEAILETYKVDVFSPVGSFIYGQGGS